MGRSHDHGGDCVYATAVLRLSIWTRLAPSGADEDRLRERIEGVGNTSKSVIGIPRGAKLGGPLRRRLSSCHTRLREERQAKEDCCLMLYLVYACLLGAMYVMTSSTFT